MPKITLDNLVLVSQKKIYTNLQKYTSKRLDFDEYKLENLSNLF